jgi:hypothetical protein
MNNQIHRASQKVFHQIHTTPVALTHFIYKDSKTLLFPFVIHEIEIPCELTSCSLHSKGTSCISSKVEGDAQNTKQ